VETILLYGKDGTEYRAYVHQEWLDASSMDGFASMPGLKTVMLFNGIPLNYLDKDTFKN